MSSRSTQIIGGSDRQHAHVDSVTNGLHMIPPLDHTIHSALLHSTSHFDSQLGQNQSLDLLISTGSRPVHARLSATVSQDMGAHMFENVTTSLDGTSQRFVVARNRSLPLPPAPETTVWGQPTVTDLGNALLSSYLTTGPKRGPGGTFDGTIEWVLRPNTKYLARLLNNFIAATASVDLSLLLYEEPPT